MALEFITVEDCSTDNILTCEESDITYANSYLETLALGFGLAEDEIAIPCSEIIKRFGVVVAYRTRALAMVGSDATVMVDGNRSDDIYLQKYKLYNELADKLEAKLDYASFAVENTSGAGKGGVGIIRLSRA